MNAYTNVAAQDKYSVEELVERNIDLVRDTQAMALDEARPTLRLIDRIFHSGVSAHGV